jgi:hypothetical protein
MELNPDDTKTPEITLFEIINDEKRKENHVADQFFRSLLEVRVERSSWWTHDTVDNSHSDAHS